LQDFGLQRQQVIDASWSVRHADNTSLRETHPAREIACRREYISFSI
jgi:hypothetical protein